MGISKRAYAERRGVSPAAVRKAIKTGRIDVEPDGTIDPEKADAQWERNTDPARRKANGNRNAETGNQEVPVRTQDDAREAINLIKRVLDEEGQTGLSGFDAARTADTILKAYERDLSLAKSRGELVDKQKATELIFAKARAERDVWLQWPARVGALMAAELKVDPHQMETVLDAYVREHLAEIPGFRLELR